MLEEIKANKELLLGSYPSNRSETAWLAGNASSEKRTYLSVTERRTHSFTN
jgi:hypothetical protein